MVCAFVRRKLGVAVNRKRVLRVMRERKLIQRRRPLERRKRPGFFRVERIGFTNSYAPFVEGAGGPR